MVLALAVVLGVVLLQQLGSGSGSSQLSANAAVEETTSTTRRVTLTTVPAVIATSTSVRARAKSDVKVVVANGGGVRGAGASSTATLKSAGYATLAPVDATAPVEKTTIQYADGYEAEGREVAQTLNQPPTVVARLSAPAVAATDIGDAKVIVVLGADSAGTSTTVKR